MLTKNITQLQGESRLFAEPVAERDSLRIGVTDIRGIDDSSNNTSVKRPDIEVLSDHLIFLAENFDSLVIEYDQILRILRARADARSIQIDVSKILDSRIANAVQTIFGTQAKILTFTDYIRLFELEQELIAVRVSSTTEDLQLIPDLSPKIDPISSPQIDAVGLIKSAFIQEFKDKNAYDLMIVDNVIAMQFAAKTDLSSLQVVAKTNDNVNMLSPGNVGPSSSSSSTAPWPDASSDSPTFGPWAQKNFGVDSIKDYLKNECIPCFERSLYMLQDDMFIQDTVRNYINSANASWIAQAQALIRMKLSIANFSYAGTLCSMIDILMNTLCLPDLVSLLAMVNISIMNSQQLLNPFKSANSLKIDLGASVAEISNMLVKAYVAAAIAILTKLLSSVTSPIDCIITSLRAQLNKVLPAIDSVAGTKSSAGFDSILLSISENKVKLENTLIGYLNDAAGALTITINASANKIDLLTRLSEFKRFHALILEIVNLSKSMIAQVNKGLPIQFYKDLCSKSLLSIDTPWISLVSVDNTTAAAINEITNGTPTIDFSMPPQVTDPTITIPTPPILLPDGLSPDTFAGTVAVDSTVPSDFFNSDFDNMMISQLDNGNNSNNLPLFKVSPYNLETGESTGTFDEALLNAYAKQIKIFNAVQAGTSSVINSTLSPLQSQAAGVPSFSVVRYARFSDCIPKSNADYSQSEVEAWLNKITG